MTEMKSEITAIAPLSVAIIGGTGSGAPLTTGTTATTPDHQPNLALRVITPLVAIMVRAGNVFFLTLSGIVTANAFLHMGDFKALLITAAIATGIGIIKDCATIFGKLEGKFPLATGSI